MVTKTKETKKEVKKLTVKDLTNFDLLKLLERFGVKYSVKIDDKDSSKYYIFVRKENIFSEMQLICLNRLHFGKGKEAYIKVLKKGMTPYEYLIEESDKFKLDHPDYVSKKQLAEKQIEIELEEEDEEIEVGENTDDIPF